jgi:hypothetical protein
MNGHQQASWCALSVRPGTAKWSSSVTMRYRATYSIIRSRGTFVHVQSVPQLALRSLCRNLDPRLNGYMINCRGSTEKVMDKKTRAIGGFSALLLASTPAAMAEQKIPAASDTTVRAIQTQRSKSINPASPAAVLKLNRNQIDHDSGWIEHFTNGHTSTTNPIGNVQKTLKSR